MMRRRPLGALLATSLLSSIAIACGPGDPRSARSGSSSPASLGPTQAEGPGDKRQSAHRAALEEAARLRALADSDPLLAPWTGPHGGLPPWDRLDSPALAAALETGAALRQAEVDAIAANPAPPTFANTIGPLEDAGRHLRRVGIGSLFDVLTNNLSTDATRALEQEWAPKLAAAADRIVFHPELFPRIQAVHSARDSAGLTPEQKRLVEHIHEQFVRAGARLSAEQKEEMGALNRELAALATEFNNKLQAEESTWIVLEKPDDLAGLPDSLRAAYKAAAQERNLPGKWAVVNTRGNVDPFLTFSARRDLREKVWKRFKSRGDNGDAHDTDQTVAKIVKLRARRAGLLGYPSYAHWHLADTMARDPRRAQELMLRVWPAAVARVREEVAEMSAIARSEGAAISIEPWDYLHYAEKVRVARYALDQDKLRPYFEFDHMLAASFWMAERLYGLRFEEITGRVPSFHPDVRIWTVSDAARGSFAGILYGDYFARPGKDQGAWTDRYRGRDSFTGTTYTPIVSNNNNFVKGAPGQPVLLSLSDAQVLFRELGRSLIWFMCEANYPGLADLPRDFAEYPTQLHEMWLLTRPVLDRFARHYKTGAPIPQSLVAKVESARKFNQGYAMVEYLSAAIVDMELHLDPSGAIDPDAFERRTLERIGAPREVAMRHRLPHFVHLFATDYYAAGYYSYLWSEVMDADTREAFAEAGDAFDRATADKLRRFILAPGNTTDRAEAYRQFRGRDPDVVALFKKRGFPIDGAYDQGKVKR